MILIDLLHSIRSLMAECSSSHEQGYACLQSGFVYIQIRGYQQPAVERKLSGLSLNYNLKWSVKLLYEYARPLTCHVLCASDTFLETNSLLSLILNHAKFPLMMQRSLKEDANVGFLHVCSGMEQIKIWTEKVKRIW